jgi:hypothetical protein
MEKYNDPKFKKIVPKVAVVISSFIGGIQYYGHSYSENKLDSLKLNLSAHKHFDSGVDYDLFVINNGSTNNEGKKFHNEIGSLNRENEGYSFGGWKWAWEQLKDKGYMFFLFTEDDIAPCKDKWLSEIVNKFFSEPEVGAVGSFIEVHSKGYNEFIDSVCDCAERNPLVHFDGAFTFTSANILRQVDEIGGLLVLDSGTNHSLGVRNELLFQTKILELGYSLVDFKDGNHFVVHGSEIFSNDIKYRNGEIEPLLNVNGIKFVPEIKEAFNWYSNSSEIKELKKI